MIPLDLGDEAPAMNYQVASIADLKDRQASYSQAIKLPKTAHNMRAFGFIDEFDVVAVKAYGAGRCELRCDGARISPLGSVLRVQSVEMSRGGMINCQIVAGAADLFTLLDDSEWLDPDGLWTDQWTADRIAAENANASDIRRRWPQIEPVKEARSFSGTFGTSGAAQHQQYVQAYHLAPCYHLNSLVREIFENQGYEIESDLLNDDFINTLYCTSSKIVPRGEQNGRIHSTATGANLPVPILVAPGEALGWRSVYATPSNTTNAGTTATWTDDVGIAYTAVQFIAEEPGTYVTRLTIVNRGPNPIDGTRKMRYDIRVDGSSVKASTQISIAVGETFVVSVEEEVPIGAIIEVRLLEANASSATTPARTYVDWDVDFQIVVNEGGIASSPSTSDAGIGTTFNLAESTGLKSEKEFVKAYLQLFGAMIDVVHFKAERQEVETIGRIRIYSFGEIYRRRNSGNVVDWSSRLVLSESQESAFAISNYAQRNRIEMKGNDDSPDDGAVIEANNTTLESERTLFSIAFEAGRNISLAPNLQGTTAVVPILEMEDKENDTDEAPPSSPLRPVWLAAEYKGCGSRIIALDNNRANWVEVVDTTGAYQHQHRLMQIPPSTYYPMREYVDRYYQAIEKMLHNARTLSVSLMLDVYDIESLDMMTPVYLKQYGAYFFIEKINNFIAGVPTKVDFVKL